MELYFSEYILSVLSYVVSGVEFDIKLLQAARLVYLRMWIVESSLF